MGPAAVAVLGVVLVEGDGAVADAAARRGGSVVRKGVGGGVGCV
jgi:hypothetical protein